MNEMIITSRGLSDVKSLSNEDFMEVGHELARAEKGLAWAMGDWYNELSADGRGRSDDESKKAACGEVGLKYETCRAYGRLACKFNNGNRLPLLGIAHYQIANSPKLTEDQQLKLLEHANESKWTTTKLKQERDKMLNPNSVDAVADTVTSTKSTGRPKATAEDQLDKFIKTDVEGKFSDSKTKKIRKVFEKQMAETETRKLKEIQSQYEADVEAGIKSALGRRLELLEEREKDVAEEEVMLKNQQKRLNNLLTATEYKKLRSAVHPDKHVGCDMNGKMDEASQLVKRLKDSVPAGQTGW